MTYDSIKISIDKRARLLMAENSRISLSVIINSFLINITRPKIQ